MNYSEGQWAYIDAPGIVHRIAQFEDGVWKYGAIGRASSTAVTNVRPVVILEVDDDLRDFARVSGTGFGVNRIAKRVAEQLPPEKPAIEEPRGFGAVVRLLWSGRLASRTKDPMAPWRTEHGEFLRWSDLDVAEVLFEGVTS